MKNITRHTGKIRMIERLKNSKNGNPQFILGVFDYPEKGLGWSFRTPKDSMLGYKIQNNRTGEMLAMRPLAPNEKLDLEVLVHREIKKLSHDEDEHWSTELEIADNVPNGCADFYAQIRTSKNDSLCVWSTADFFYKNIACG